MTWFLEEEDDISPLGLVSLLTENDLRVVPLALSLVLTLQTSLRSEGLTVLQPTQLLPSEIKILFSLSEIYQVLVVAGIASKCRPHIICK